MARTNEKINQTFKGFLKNDPDKKNPKHGLACEYLFDRLRQKQYIKEITWLKISLKSKYKEFVAKEIKELIRLLKNNKKIVKSSKETLFTLKVEQDNLCDLDWAGMDDETFKKEEKNDKKIERRIDYYEQEIKRLNEYRETYLDNIKKYLECRTEIFRLLSQLKNPIFLQSFKKVIYDKHIIPSKCIEAPINSLTMRGQRTNSVICFADVLIPYSELDGVSIFSKGEKWSNNFDVDLCANIYHFITVDTLQIKKEHQSSVYFDSHNDKYLNSTLGEVKISKEPAENILQHINQYHEFVNPTQTFVCLDYEDTQLKNLTENSKIKVVKLGPKFIEFCENRPAEEIEEI